MNKNCFDDESLKAIANDNHERLSNNWLAHLDECNECQLRLDKISGAIEIKDTLTQINDKSDQSVLLQTTIAEFVPRRNTKPRQYSGFDLDSILKPIDPSDKNTDPDSLGMFGPYEVLEVTGQGGMGVVLKSRDPKLDRIVAIKLMLSDNAELRQRFLQEARALAAVVHENVVTIYSAEELDGMPCIVMQYVDCRSVKELLDENGAFASDQVVEIGLQVSAGLAAVHRRGLVHRDVKPANILIDRETGQALIGDFGLAKESSSEKNDLTAEARIIGTPKYMSPEQAQEFTADKRSDLFSLGGVLYEMCTGTPPFKGNSTLDVLNQVCNESVVPIPSLNFDIPKPLVGVIDRLLEKQPKDRFQTADELSNSLLSLSGPAPSNSAVWRKIAAAIMVALVGLAIVAGVFFIQGNPPKAIENGFWLESSREHFLTLSDAVEAASSKDIISIKGSGPFETEPISIEEKSLTIRSSDAAKLIATTASQPIFTVNNHLELDGLELVQHSSGKLNRRSFRKSIEGTQQESLIYSRPNATLRVSNCRLSYLKGGLGLAIEGRITTIENCEILTPMSIGIAWNTKDNSSLKVINCKIVSQLAFAAYPGNEKDARGVDLELSRNTWIGPSGVDSRSAFMFIQEVSEGNQYEYFRLKLKSNLLVGNCLFLFNRRNAKQKRNRLPNTLRFEEQNNVYAIGNYMGSPTLVINSLEDWRDMAGSQDTSSVEADFEMTDETTVDRSSVKWKSERKVENFGASEFVWKSEKVVASSNAN